MFMADISMIVRKMRTFAERSLSEFDLGFPEQIVLMHLMVHGQSNQESIAAALGIDKGAITKTITKLEAKGLITRKENPRNRREKLVVLTAQAQPAIEALKESFLRLQEIMFKGLSPDQVEQFNAALAQVAAALSEEVAP